MQLKTIPTPAGLQPNDLQLHHREIAHARIPGRHFLYQQATETKTLRPRKRKGKEEEEEEEKTKQQDQIVGDQDTVT